LSFILDEGITILPRTNVLSAITASLAKSYAEVNRERVLEIIALLSREDNFRAAFTKCQILDLVIPYLLSQEPCVQLQAVRVIGNLCYENDEGRESLLLSGGCKHLIQLMEEWTSSTISDRFRSIVCGCTLNVIANNEKLTKEFSALGVEKTVTNVLNVVTSEDAIDMALRLMSCVDGSSLGTFLQYGCDQRIETLLMQLSSTETIKYANTLLDFLQSAADQEEWKVVIAERNWLPLLLGVKDEDLLKQGADITVLVLNSDSCMKQIMDKGHVIQIARQWMEGSGSLYLKATGALFVANMARSDESCLFLMDSGILVPLKKLLNLDPSVEGAASVFQGSLSALRNLAIPVDNKQKLFNAGIADDAIRHLESKSPTVQFKALGTIRLMVDKQESICNHILSHIDAIQRICELCALGSHLQMEGCRLLASLVKYSKDQTTPTKVVLEADGGKWLVNLLSTGNALMINEGLIALAIVSSKKDSHLNEKLSTTIIVPSLFDVLRDQKMSQEIISNGLALLVQLAHDERFSPEMSSNNVFEVISAFKIHESKEISERAQQVEGLLSRHMKMPDNSQ
jgi:hypothetical protein